MKSTEELRAEARRLMEIAGKLSGLLFGKAAGGRLLRVQGDPGRSATASVSRQIGENPVISVLVGCALGYIAGWWIHGRTVGYEEPQTIRQVPKHSRGRS
jgi:hypothetical protein